MIVRNALSDEGMDILISILQFLSEEYGVAEYNYLEFAKEYLETEDESTLCKQYECFGMMKAYKELKMYIDGWRIQNMNARRHIVGRGYSEPWSGEGMRGE